MPRACAEFVDNAMQPNGGVYTGRLVGKKRDGRGRLTLQQDGGQHAYDGNWIDGQMNGWGVHTWPNGTMYNGEWKSGVPDGWGTRRDADGGWYEGLWRAGGWHRGTRHDPNGVDVYEGEWVWDNTTKGYKQQGWGVWRKKMVKGGDGTYSEAPPGGDVQAGVMVTVYEGAWNNDQMHGHGMWRSPETGTIYCGEWDHDEMCGPGRMLIGENSRYHDTGGSYVGLQKDWRFHGEGVRVWSNGDRYQGNWEDGMEHGNGTKRWARDGSSFNGVWERGVPVKGTMVWPNGDMFTGTFREVADQLQGRELKIYRGDGVLSLSSLPSMHGDILMAWGSLRGNAFHRADDSVVLHVMGSSLPQLGHSELIKKLKEEYNKEREIEGTKWTTERTQLQNLMKTAEKEASDVLLAVHNNIANETSQKQRQSEALCELSTAFKVTTKLRLQLKKAAPLLVSLEESVSALMPFLQSATERNQALDVHLRELSTLREALEKAAEESDRRCKEILGQTLTVESSESEIQKCSRNISSLMKKLLGIQPLSSPFNTEDQRTQSIPSKDVNKLMTLKPWLLQKSLEPPPTPSSTSGPFTLVLQEITDTVSLTQGGCTNFDNCLKVIEKHTVIHQELNTQAALAQRLHKEIEELLSTCHVLNKAHNHKFLVMRGLEGDEQFMSHPDVWSQLSELLPQAQQAIVELSLSKATSSSASGCQQQQPRSSLTTAARTTLPGCTTTSSPVSLSSSSVPNHNNNESNVCMECEERPPDMQLQPCGHIVLCSQCAAVMRKCPDCRTFIKDKIHL
ncbi:2-isopropylmalate synthase [Pelomyxa schiedti]|nr:2-isopropylmalate synthase [Pelomyxa schiedti]